MQDQSSSPDDIAQDVGSESSDASHDDQRPMESLTTENEQLRRALATRDVIGQAKGILMERYEIDADAAFGLLVKTSQDTNTRLTEVARKLVGLEGPLTRQT